MQQVHKNNYEIPSFAVHHTQEQQE